MSPIFFRSNPSYEAIVPPIRGLKTSVAEDSAGVLCSQWSSDSCHVSSYSMSGAWKEEVSHIILVLQYHRNMHLPTKGVFWYTYIYHAGQTTHYSVLYQGFLYFVVIVLA